MGEASRIIMPLKFMLLITQFMGIMFIFSSKVSELIFHLFTPILHDIGRVYFRGTAAKDID